MTLSKSQPWATLYQPMNLIPNFSSYCFICRGIKVFMKNLKNGSRPRRTEKKVARTGTGSELSSFLWGPILARPQAARFNCIPGRSADKPLRRLTPSGSVRFGVLVGQAPGGNRQENAAGQLAAQQWRVLALRPKRLFGDQPSIGPVENDEVGRGAFDKPAASSGRGRSH